MKLITMLAAFAVLAGFSLDASAQDGRKKGERGGKKREAMLKKFDKDGDGKLGKEERAAAREFRREHRGDKGGARKEGLRKRILKRFDQDGDRKLDDSERESLRKFLESHHKKGKSERRRR